VPKGKGGGYYLIKEKDINMAKVYHILEGPMLCCLVLVITLKNARTVQMKLPAQCVN
jgi:DNA-binding IscR family transcriptional regulator